MQTEKKCNLDILQRTHIKNIFKTLKTQKKKIK